MLQHRATLPTVFLVAILLLAACGEGASPTATPAATQAAVATPTARPATTPSGGAPTPAATAAVADLKFAPTYPDDLVKKYVAEGFSLPGMQSGAGQTPQYGGTATISNRGDLPSDDPMMTGTSTFQQPMSPVLGGGLLRPKPEQNFDVEGYLAESWSVSSDFMTWTFKLRPDIKWHDGTQFDAEHAKFWIDLAVFPPKGRRTASYFQNFGQLKEVQVVDKLTINLVMKEPQPFLVESLLSGSSVASHPMHLAKPVIDGGKVTVALQDVNWTSLGPFKLDKYEKGSSLRHVRFDQYFEKDKGGKAMPYLDSLYYAIIPDANVMVSAFRAGRLDATARGTGYHLTPDMTANIKKSLGDKAFFMRFPYVSWSANLNSTKPPFNDIRVRKALYLYSDRQLALKLVYGGYGLEGGIMAPGSDWADPTIRERPGYNAATKQQDQAEAKRLLQEAGLVGSPLTLTCRDIWLSICEFLDLTTRELGFNAKIEMNDINILNEKTQSGNYQVTTRSGGAAHPGQLLLPYLTANPLVTVKTGDPQIDEMHRQISATVDPVERRKLVRKAEDYILTEKMYDIYWFFEEAVIAYRTYLKGMYTPNRTVQNNNSFADMWLDKSMKTT